MLQLILAETGTQAHGFHLRGLDEKQYDLGEALRSGPVVLTFYKRKCPTVAITFPYLVRLFQAYPSQRWHFWGVSQDGEKLSRGFAAQQGASFPVLLDENNREISKTYGVTVTPTIFLVQPDGQITYCSLGFNKADLNAISERIARHLGVEPVTIAFPDDGNPAMRPGCTVLYS